MNTKIISLVLLVVILSSTIIGCSAAKQTSQFIEVHVQSKAVSINIDHIVSVQPSGNGAVILMDTSNGMTNGYLNISEKYDTIIKELSK
jgi:predicted S18 family serine protease